MSDSSQLIPWSERRCAFIETELNTDYARTADYNISTIMQWVMEMLDEIWQQ